MSTLNEHIFNTNYSDENLALHRATPYDRKFIDLRFSLIQKYGVGKDALDLCCGTGSYLIPTLDLFKSVVGIDFSTTMLSMLRKKIENISAPHLKLLECNAEQLPLESASFDFVFSYTSLYCIEHLGRAINEVSRVLRPNGHAVLEIGNCRSINQMVADVMHQDSGWAKMYALSLSESMEIIQRAGLRVIRSRSFQILPMYGAPRRLFYLYPLLSTHWKKIMGVTIADKMLDEWVSSLSVLRPFAFRHIMELEKRTTE